jgi:photosystem II PsbU protein
MRLWCLRNWTYWRIGVRYAIAAPCARARVERKSFLTFLLFACNVFLIVTGCHSIFLEILFAIGVVWVDQLMDSALSCYLCSSATAFVAQSSTRSSSALSATTSDRRAFFGAASAVAAAALVPTAALAVRDYENVGYLGGSEIVDINNANVRVYLKMPGMYPTIAGKVASGGPYSSVSDVYNIPGLSGKEKEILKKYESRFVAKKPEADYVIDKINNGLYR